MLKGAPIQAPLSAGLAMYETVCVLMARIILQH